MYTCKHRVIHTYTHIYTRYEKWDIYNNDGNMETSGVSKVSTVISVIRAIISVDIGLSGFILAYPVYQGY